VKSEKAAARALLALQLEPIFAKEAKDTAIRHLVGNHLVKELTECLAGPTRRPLPLLRPILTTSPTSSPSAPREPFLPRSCRIAKRILRGRGTATVGRTPCITQCAILNFLAPRQLLGLPCVQTVRCRTKDHKCPDTTYFDWTKIRPYGWVLPNHARRAGASRSTYGLSRVSCAGLADRRQNCTESRAV
jgi:hypothetical protein